MVRYVPTMTTAFRFRRGFGAAFLTRSSSVVFICGAPNALAKELGSDGQGVVVSQVVPFSLGYVGTARRRFTRPPKKFLDPIFKSRTLYIFWKDTSRGPASSLPALEKGPGAKSDTRADHAPGLSMRLEGFDISGTTPDFSGSMCTDAPQPGLSHRDSTRWNFRGHRQAIKIFCFCF